MIDFLVRRFVRNADEVTQPRVRAAYGNLAGIVCIICNLLLCGGKFLVGTLAGSIAISADALNNLSDASSNIISLVGFRMAEKPADLDHPYGHARYEYLSGLAVAILILIIGLELVKTSIEKILHPTAVSFSWLAAGVLVISILVKLWMALFNRRLGKKISSATLEATAADSRNDVIATAAVLLGSLLAHFVGLELDGWMGLAVALFILYSGVGIVKDTMDPLLGMAPDPALIQHIHDKALSYPGVLGVHDLMVHDYGPGRQFASLHVEMAAEGDVLESHDLIDNIERDFMENDHLSVVIHFDPIVTNDPKVHDLRHWLAGQVKEISPELSVHDLRTVPGPSHTNVIFDCVTPPGFAMPENELKKKIEALVQAEHPDYYCVITVEQSFAVPHA